MSADAYRTPVGTSAAEEYALDELRAPGRLATYLPRRPKARHMEDEIVPADKRLRRRVWWWAGLVTVAGLILLGILAQLLHVPADATDQDLKSVAARAARFVTIIAWLSGLCFVGVGLWFLRLGHRIRRTGRFPPPGMKVIQDTPVRTGTKARGIANLATATGLLSAVFGSAAAWYLCRLAVAVVGR